MKKFALAIGLVLALSVSALAAAPTLTGSLEVKGVITDSGTTWSLPSVKADLGVTGDNYVLSIGNLASTKTVLDADSEETTVPSFAVKNAYLKTALPIPGTLYMGQKYGTSSVDWQGLWYGATFGNLSVNGYYGLGASYGNKYKADATLKFGANAAASFKAEYKSSDGYKAGTVTVPFGPITAEARLAAYAALSNEKSYGKGTYKFAEGCDVYAQYWLDSDWTVGADWVIAGITLAADYGMDTDYEEDPAVTASFYDLSASAKLKGITYTLSTDESTDITVSAKVSF